MGKSLRQSKLELDDFILEASPLIDIRAKPTKMARLALLATLHDQTHAPDVRSLYITLQLAKIFSYF